MRCVAIMLAAAILASSMFLPVDKGTEYSGAMGSLFDETRTDIPFNAPWIHVVAIGSPRIWGGASGVNPRVFQRILYELEAINPYAVVSTGDNTRSGTRREIDLFYTVMKGLRNVLAVAGETDMAFPGNSAYWRQRIAPDTYFFDGVPGWRIIVLNTSMGLNQLSRVDVMEMYSTPRHKIVVVHKPIEPELVVNGTSYNMEPRKRFWLRAVFADKGVDMVLQGHYPGYAETVHRGTRYIVTGGAGARVLPGEENHYLVILLYPDGHYTVEPIAVDRGSLTIHVAGSALLINNTKETISGSPAAVPVSISLEQYTGLRAEAVVLAGRGVTMVNYTVAGERLTVYANASSWYLVYNGTAYKPSRGTVSVAIRHGIYTRGPAPASPEPGLNASKGGASTGDTAAGGGAVGGAEVAGLAVLVIAVLVLVLVAAAIRMLR